MHRYALGFRDHTGWAAAVLLERGEPQPPVRVSRRIDLCPPDLPNEVYHAAASLDRDAGKALVAAVRDTVRDMARAQVSGLLSEFGVDAVDAVAAVPVSTSRIPESVAAVTRAHAMMHAAEGHLYREALAQACSDEGLEVHRYPNRQLQELASGALHAPEGLASRLSAMGEGFGPPWTRDQKDAVLVAWLALASRP
jgi:hypothetical protein